MQSVHPQQEDVINALHVSELLKRREPERRVAPPFRKVMLARWNFLEYLGRRYLGRRGVLRLIAQNILVTYRVTNCLMINSWSTKSRFQLCNTGIAQSDKYLHKFD